MTELEADYDALAARLEQREEELREVFSRVLTAIAQRDALAARLGQVEWVLQRAEEIVAYEHGKTAAYSFTQAWGELPEELKAGR